MIAAAIVIAVLILILFLRFGIIAEFGESDENAHAELTIKIVIGLFKRQVFPQTKKPKGHKSKQRQKKKAKKTTVQAGRLAELKSKLPAIEQLLSRLRRKLLISELTIWYKAAGENPAVTALWFGGAQIGYGFLTSLLENHFRIKKRDFRSMVSFEEKEPYIYLRARISLAVWEAIYIATPLFKSLLKGEKITTKSERRLNNGQASNRRPDGNNNAENSGNG